jgi:hypothetical protein
MSGAILPFPHYTSMVWCSVKKKHRDNVTFFTFTFKSTVVGRLEKIVLWGAS